MQGPVVVAANISLTLTTLTGSSHPDAIAAVASAIETYIANLGIGVPLNYTKIAQLSYAASESVSNVAVLLLNGATSDLPPPLFGVVRTGTVSVS